ncbi:baculoviral IAP repeat-containing protein 5.1-like [Mobula birostris]|uniref:baculoviral IAP repeat-containing protein 5.1-like n=1 Tax=Mobula birostris TaxID=1983395 RepID=UPI003B285D69
MADHISCLLEHRLMYFYENRLATFINWPFTESCCCCTPENMAKAGFLHCPTEDELDVVCFFCLKELESWEPKDDPWAVHQSHSPSCEFLALKMDVLDLTVEEFFKLEMDWLKMYLVLPGVENGGQSEILIVYFKVQTNIQILWKLNKELRNEAKVNEKQSEAEDKRKGKKQRCRSEKSITMCHPYDRNP